MFRNQKFVQNLSQYTVWILLQEWSEDLFFLELRIADLCEQTKDAPDSNMGDETIEKLGASILEGTIFDVEISHFADFRKTWISNLVYVISERFERNCISYSSKTKCWVNDDFDTVDGESYTHLLSFKVSRLSSLCYQMSRVYLFLSKYLKYRI